MEMKDILVKHKKILSTRIMALNIESQVKYHENEQPVIYEPALAKHVTIAAVCVVA